ncbi:MAG: response regulator [Hydrogenophilales bacterium]|nr:response regulator [Hydrogenophilales bacterium]
MYRLLLVDDEENILRALRRTLSVNDGSAHQFDVEIFSSPAAALHRADEVKFDLVLSDYRMPEMDGVQFLRQFRDKQPDAARLVLSGYADLDGLIGAINEAQIFRFIPKPWHDAELRVTLTQALSYHALQAENRLLADRVRAQQGKLTRQEFELRRLETEHPGITKVNWGPNGEVMLDEDAL